MTYRVNSLPSNKDSEKILRALMVRDRVVLRHRAEENGEERYRLSQHGREAIRAARQRQHNLKAQPADPPGITRRANHG